MHQTRLIFHLHIRYQGNKMVHYKNFQKSGEKQIEFFENSFLRNNYSMHRSLKQGLVYFQYHVKMNNKL